MLRRVVMWVAVASLACLAIASGTSCLILAGTFGNGGWTFYTPASQPGPFLMSVALTCGSVYRATLPPGVRWRGRTP